jgi:hypothetical protein
MMHPAPSPDDVFDEIHRLVMACLSSEASPDDIGRLDQLVCTSDDACRVYVRAMLDSRHLHQWAGDNAEAVSAQNNQQAEVDVPSGPADGSPSPCFSPAAAPAPLSLPSYLSLTTPLGSFLFSYGAAAVIVGIGILLAWVYHVPEPQADRLHVVVSRPSTATKKPELPEERVVGVARVTGMVDITWANSNLAPSIQRILLGDKFALASGLMEISYDTGAKVVLQGPCTYTVESRTGGFLERGRLTARVESAVGSRQSAVSNTTPTYRTSSSNSLPTADCRLPTLFSVRTPNAVVTDLGTEFGVEVDEHTGSRVQVFVGTVDFVPEGRPLGGIRLSAGDARRISAARGAVVEKIAFDSERFAKPRAVLAGKLKHDEILFHDTFENFALGMRWRATYEGPPDDVLQAVRDEGRPALWMKNSPAKPKSPGAAIETVERFLLRELAAIEADVLFRVSKDVPPPFQVWISGSSRKMVRMSFLPGVGHRIYLDANDVSNPKRFVRLVSHHSPDMAYQDGGRYRCLLSVNRQGSRLVVRDDVNLAVVYQTDFDGVTLADLGDDASVVLRLARPPNRVDQAGECWVFSVTVRGRRSATHYPSLKNAARHASPSLPTDPSAPSHSTSGTRQDSTTTLATSH